MYLFTYLLIKARAYCTVHVLGLWYFFVGRHEDTVDENDQHHQQAEERALSVKVQNNESHITALKYLLNS